MHFDDANDDLAIPRKEFKVVACLPVFSRLPLLKQTINRLYQKNKCYKVICSGDGVQEKELCESLGAVWVPSQNKPLGKKWNRAFSEAKKYHPDAVVYVGSSDFLSDEWFSVMEPLVKVHDFVGVAGCHFVDVHVNESYQDLRGVYWKGYKATRFHKDRADETIGIGRMISARLMNSLGWKPFDDLYDNSLDRSMNERCKKAGFNDFMVEDDRLKAVSISTNKWPNKHNFSYHWANDPEANVKINATDFVNKNFPEINDIFK